MKQRVQPPRLACQILCWSVRQYGKAGEAILGDLWEEHQTLHRDSSWKADAWFWRQTFNLAIYLLAASWLKRLRRFAVRLRLYTKKLTNRIRDLKSIGNSLRRAPGFMVAAVVTLGAGIGVTTFLFCALSREPGNPDGW